MRSITVYEIEANDIEEWADKYNLTTAEIVEILVDAVKCGDTKIEDYLA